MPQTIPEWSSHTHSKSSCKVQVASTLTTVLVCRVLVLRRSIRRCNHTRQQATGSDRQRTWQNSTRCKDHHFLLIQFKRSFSTYLTPARSWRRLKYSLKYIQHTFTRTFCQPRVIRRHYVNNCHTPLKKVYSGTPLMRTPLGPSQSVLIRGVS